MYRVVIKQAHFVDFDLLSSAEFVGNIIKHTPQAMSSHTQRIYTEVIIHEITENGDLVPIKEII